MHAVVSACRARHTGMVGACFWTMESIRTLFSWVEFFGQNRACSVWVHPTHAVAGVRATYVTQFGWGLFLNNGVNPHPFLPSWIFLTHALLPSVEIYLCLLLFLNGMSLSHGLLNTPPLWDAIVSFVSAKFWTFLCIMSEDAGVGSGLRGPCL